jgi:integrase
VARKKRRSYGVGRIFQRGPIWWASVYVNGKEHRESSKSKEKSDAEELLGRLLRERSRGELADKQATSPKGGISVSELIDEYLNRKKLAPGTMATYRSQAITHLKPFFGNTLAAKLTTDMISDYRDHRTRQESLQGNNRKVDEDRRPVKGRRKKVTETTINRELALLRAAMRDMWKRRPAAVPSVPYFPIEREDNTRQGFLSEERFIDSLYPALPRHLKALSACAFYAGGRRSEWLRVDWEWVDFARLMIYFPKTKGRKPREVLIIPGLMLESLIEAKRQHDVMWPDVKAVFVYDGVRITTPRRAWATAIKNAGLDGLLFHDMRRSANKFMRDKGLPQPIRMKIMGHQTTAMDNRYSIVDQADMDEARNKMASRPELKLVKGAQGS